MSCATVFKNACWIAVVFALVGCGSEGDSDGGKQWMDIPGVLGANCNDESVKEFSGRGNEFAAGYCSSIAKMATGEARCDGDRLQVQCE